MKKTKRRIVYDLSRFGAWLGQSGRHGRSALLGETRISAQAFESPDGSDLSFDLDILGARHTASRTPGPLASLKAGDQSIVVWKQNRMG